MRDPSAGYGSTAAAESLRRAVERGVDAVLIPVYAYAEGEPPALPGSLGPRGLRASEGDAALFAAAARATELGCRVVLEPHLLASPTAGLYGELPLTDTEDWDGFFDALDAHGVHFALLSELLGSDLYCIATHVPNAAATALEADQYGRDLAAMQAHKRERWSRHVAAVRGAFSGALTYGVAMDGMQLKVELWPQLDFFGAQLWKPVWPPGWTPESGSEPGTELWLDAQVRSSASSAP